MLLISFRRARAARGRFATGSSGNPRGRPRGIPIRKRLVPDLAARKLSPQALADLLDRRPHLLHSVAAQLLPPPAAIDPAEGARLARRVRTRRRARRRFARLQRRLRRSPAGM